MEFKDRLQLLRKTFNYKQKYIAQQIGVSQPNYSKYESSDVTLKLTTLVKILKLYSVGADWLLMGDRNNIHDDGMESCLRVWDLKTGKLIFKADFDSYGEAYEWYGTYWSIDETAFDIEEL